jgi:hypothetical protein
MAGFSLIIVIALAEPIRQLALIRAFSQGEAAMLAPYSYSGLAFVAFWGSVFFVEIPDFWTVLGSCVIAGAGLYFWHRETNKKAKTLNDNWWLFSGFDWPSHAAFTHHFLEAHQFLADPGRCYY